MKVKKALGIYAEKEKLTLREKLKLDSVFFPICTTGKTITEVFLREKIVTRILCSTTSSFICEDNRKTSRENMFYHVPNPEKIL